MVEFMFAGKAWFMIASMCVCLVSVSLGGVSGHAPVTELNQDQDDVSRRDMMRTKLTAAKNIVEGLANEDYKLIEQSANDIAELTKAEKWLAYKSDEYAAQSKYFRIAAEELAKNAKNKNLDGATMRYFNMTTRCVDCHKMLRKQIF